MTYSVKLQVELTGTSVKHIKSVSFDAITPCSCATLSPETILNTSDTLTIYKEFLPEIRFGTNIFQGGWLNHLKACWGPEY